MVYPVGPLKRENRLSAVPTDQAGRTVARPHHNDYSKREPGVRQSGATNLPNQSLNQTQKCANGMPLLKEGHQGDAANCQHQPAARIVS